MAIIFGLDVLLDIADAEGDAGTLQPGARPAIAAAAAGSWAIVTSRSQQQARSHLAQLGCDAPEVVIGGEDVARGEPAPDGYLAAAARLGVPPRLCLVVEYAPSGIAAARAAGAMVMAVAATRPRADLAGADVVVDDLAVGLELLRNWIAEHGRSRR